jgi:hypothetical protein
MIQIVLDPYMLAAGVGLAVLIYDLIRGLRADWRDARSDGAEHDLWCTTLATLVTNPSVWELGWGRTGSEHPVADRKPPLGRGPETGGLKPDLNYFLTWFGVARRRQRITLVGCQELIWCSTDTHDLVLPYAKLLSGVGLVLLAAFF